MKKVIMLILLVLIVVISLNANSNEDMQEYSRKWNIEQERAERFKQETGFEGNIVQQFRENEPMKLGQLYGNFSDIVVTAKKDTVIMKQIFEQVKAKIMPYVKAEEGQLFAESVYTNIVTTGITYNQKINGYPIYRAGRLNIRYNFSTSEFVITDNTIEISSEYVPINITEDEAINIVLKHYGDKTRIFENKRRYLAYHRIKTNTGSYEYRVCYIISSDTNGNGFLGENPMNNYIDVTTGYLYAEEVISLQ
jgi:hypothetical protein